MSLRDQSHTKIPSQSSLDSQALQSELERNRQVLDVLHNITVACHGITSFKAIFEVICRELRNIFHFDSCYISLFDNQQPDRFLASLMIDGDEMEYQENMGIGELTSLILRDRRPLLFYDLLEERKTLARQPEPFGAAHKRSRSWLGVPLLIGQAAVGVISIQSYEVGRYTEHDCEQLMRIGNVVAVAIENAYLDQNQQTLSLALSEQVAARTVELATINAIAGELVLQHPLPVLLTRALDWIVPLFNLEAASVRRVDPRRNELVLEAHRGVNDHYLHALKRLPIEGEVLEHVIYEKQPYFVPPISSDGSDGEHSSAALLVLPLQTGGRVLGTLGLSGNVVMEFEQAQLDLAQAVGNQLAIAIENARLFGEQERQIGELRALGDIGRAAGTTYDLPTLLRQVHDALVPLMRPDAFAITVYDPERQIITDGISLDEGKEYDYWRNQPPPADSLTAWVLRHCQPLHFDELDKQIHAYPELGQNLIGAGKHAVSWLGVPLLNREGVAIGTIAVQSYRVAAFDARDAAFLTTVARQVALHVQNVVLLTQRERQVRELDAIGRIGALISASFDLDEMINVVYYTLQEVTNASVFSLLISEPESHVITHAKFVELGEPISLPWVDQPPAKGSMTDWILNHGEPLLFYDLSVERDNFEKLGLLPVPLGPDNPVRSWAGVPLLAQDGQTIGMLSVQHYEPNMYDQQTLEFLAQVASHVSLGVQKVRLFGERERQLIENARLFAAAQDHAAMAERQAQRMALVNRISLLLSSRLDLQEVLDLAAKELVGLFWADHTGIMLFEEERDQCTVVAEFPKKGTLGVSVPLTSTPLIAKLFENRRPLVINSVETDPVVESLRQTLLDFGITSLMVVPLISRGKVIGSIGLDSYNQPWILGGEEEDLFLTIASAIASAVENARLFAAEQAAHRTAETLRQVARVLSSSFDTREVLQLILRELRNMIAYDTASIMLLERDTLRFAAHSGFPPEIDLLEFPYSINEGSAAWMVVQRREPIIIPDTLQSTVWHEVPKHYNIRSWLGVPMVVKGRLLGVLNIDSRQPNGFTERDAEAAQAFADQAAVALENARLYEESVTHVEQELEIARRIQSNLFPRSLPQIEGLELAAICQPARETGGDFFDFVVLEHQPSNHTRNLAVIVGDASGKSITGAMLMAIARSIVRSEARNHQLPEAVMHASNRWIVDDVPQRSFVALSYATLDVQKRRLALANGGQLAPLRRRPNGLVEYLEVGGPKLPLGILPNVAYETAEFDLEPGDLLIFYTDGIVEAHNDARELFGFERLEALVQQYGVLPPLQLIDTILHHISAFIGDIPPHDDMTLVALRVV
jgi:sigma-B regulation protein RsbU (phosphoserine phosphatase)